MMDSGRPARGRIIDHSTMEWFAFSFACDLCGKQWHSERYAFHAGTPAPMDPTAHQILWNDQHDAACRRASRDASFAFNQCPVCGRRVCKACFYLSASGVSDICTACMRDKEYEGGSL